MLDRQKGNIVFQCDECGEVLETNTNDFDSARNLLKRERWAVEKIDGEWEHYCSNCR
jgi:Fe2+ or Zn2+ uptake regulation protein